MLVEDMTVASSQSEMVVSSWSDAAATLGVMGGVRGLLSPTEKGASFSDLSVMIVAEKRGMRFEDEF